MRANESSLGRAARCRALIAVALSSAVVCGAAPSAYGQALGAPAPPTPPAASAATAGAPTVATDATDGSTRGRARGLRPPKVVVSAKAHARAAELTNEAQAHYDAGRYEEASESYRQAFAVVPAPELLFNLGQCQRLLGRPQRAVKYFQAYLRLRPDAPHRPLVEQLIEENQLLGPNDPSQSSTPNDSPAISAAPAGGSPEERAAAPVHNANVMPLPPPEPLRETAAPTRLLADSRYTDQDSPAVYERWWFWTAIAVVAAGAAVTTYAVVSDQEEQDSPPMTTLGMVAWD